MTAAERAARIVEIKADLALCREAQRRVLRGGQRIAGEGRAKDEADLAALRAHERELVRELRMLDGSSKAFRVRGVVYR